MVRINGVGQVFAKILREIGIRDAEDYLKTESGQILEKYQGITDEKGFIRVNLGIKDIEYCKRYCKKLDTDIER